MLNQIAGIDANGLRFARKKTYGVKVGHVMVGGGAPIVVQSMTNTDTADVETTLQQTLELAEAGSEIVRWTVNVPEAAAAVPVIKKRLLDAGCNVPIIGDFHYNGHVLLTKYPECATALDKYRINPGNVGAGQRRDEQFSTICKVAVDNGKPVRIGVNGGSLNQELVMRKMQENTDQNLGKESEEIINDCMVLSALESTELALESGLRNDQIIISCKTFAAAGPDYRVSRFVGEDAAAAASGIDRSGHGDEGDGVVGGVAGRAAVRGHRGYDPDFADAEAGRGPARGSVCVPRIAAGAGAAVVFAERDRVPGMRTDDEHHVSGIGGADAGLYSRDDADVEDAVRRRGNDDAGGDGVHREWSGRIEGGEYRDQLAGNGRGAAVPRIY